ncbi:MAG: guanylate kinase [Eubacteriales bacterium]|jgi:guanylate kinase|nr:guanylate kinase [Eubacteriales bacterium]MDY2981838.1 guanylate kinase [Eubacteriales bacterium]
MNQSREGLLLVVSGPAGVGKGTLDKALLERHQDMKLSVSATTRAPRPGEIDGVHYFFKTEEEFKAMIERNEFLEYMHVFQTNYYGTPRSFVEEQLSRGIDVILEIDVQGAMKVKKAFPNAVMIFIAPPSMAELKSRLIGRNTETLEQIEKRFATAEKEIAMLPEYEYVVTNDVVEMAVNRMESIITAEKCKVSRSDALLAKLQGGIK